MASFLDSDLKDRLALSFKDTTNLNPLCSDVASQIQSGSLKLCTFVETLGPYITDQNVSTRQKGVMALSSVLSQLSKDYLTESELDFISMFYHDRMKDHYSVIPPVLSGVLAVVKMTHLSQSVPVSLLKDIFEHVQCQSQLLPERRIIYLIFKSLIENKLDDLRSMGPDLVYGIISSIDGERDPNNLMLLFNILPHFIKQFPLGHLTEEMFEVMACYFPVDFNPSGRDNVHVTREDLAQKLAPCLYIIPEFADYCIPLMIDKLYSTLAVAKIDSLNLLRDSVQIFGLSKVQDNLPKLWIALRKEIMAGEDWDFKTENAALEALGSLVIAISSNESVRKDFTDRIISDVKPSLYNVNSILYRQSEQLLGKVAATNKASCMQILQVIIPIYIGQYYTEPSMNDKILLIETLNNFMRICCKCEFYIQDVPELAWINILQTYLDGLIVQNIELKSKLFLGLTIQKAYLNNEQRFILYNTICNEIETGCDEIRISCHTTIADFATLYPQEILRLIEERLLLDRNEMKIELMKRKIQALLAIAKKREIGCEIIPKIVTMLTNDVDTDICLTTLQSIQKLIASKEFDYDIYHFLYMECHIIDKLISYKTNVVDHKVLISNICVLIVRNLTVEEQRTIVAKYAAILSTRIPEIDTAIIMNLLIPLRKNANLNIGTNMIENLYNITVNSHDLENRQTACKFLSILLNKMETGDLDWVVPYLEEKIDSDLKADIDIELKRYIVDLYILMTKALVMRGCRKSQGLLKNLTYLLGHNQIGQYMSQQYQILVNKYEDTLITENFCNIKIFYKQRVLGYLLQQNSNFENLIRSNYLMALIGLLKQISEELLFLYLAELVPLLIESLSLNDKHLLLWALRPFKVLSDTKHDIFCDKIQCVIPRLMLLSAFQNMDIKIAALECLRQYASYPTILINPYKQIVLNELKKAIGDRKRLVRKAAVEARLQWFMVGASRGSKE